MLVGYYFLLVSSDSGDSRISRAGAKPRELQPPPPPLGGSGSLFLSPATIKAGSTRKPFSTPSWIWVCGKAVQKFRFQCNIDSATAVCAFGSRVKLTAKTSSDLDLVAFIREEKKARRKGTVRTEQESD